jgi:hypothetical protein
MVGNLLSVSLVNLKPSFVYELEYILGGVNDLKVYPEFGIFVLEGVVAMGGRNKDLLGR